MNQPVTSALEGSPGEQQQLSPWTTPGTIILGEDTVKPAKDDARFYSVTTLIGALDKPALLYWAAEQTAIQAVAVAGSLSARIEEEGEREVIKWLRDARMRPQKGQRTASDLGTAVHDACEQYALTGIKPEVDEEVQPFLDRFDEWANIWQPEYLMAEAAIYNPTYGYAGTLDAICKIDGQTVILDYKSSRKSVGSDGNPSHPYPEVGLQLSAYRYAELVATFRARRFERYRRRYYLLSEMERELCQPVPAVDGAVVLHLTPEHADLYPVKADEEVFQSFLFTIEIFRWSNDISKRILGDPIVKGA